VSKMMTRFLSVSDTARELVGGVDLEVIGFQSLFAGWAWGGGISPLSARPAKTRA
jgi:hypothetical protein